MTKPIARLTTPSQMVAALPVYLGYVPTESLVVICCHEPRGRLGLTMRFDLPPTEHEQVLAEDIEGRVRHQRSTRVVIAVYTCSPEPFARQALVANLLRRFEDLVVTEALLIGADRFWSYLCQDEGCCPVEGTPVADGQDSSAVQLLEVERVFEGRTVLPDRAALEASLAGPSFLAATLARQRCEQALVLLEDAVDESGAELAAEVFLQGWLAALERFQDPPAELAGLEAAALAVSLQDVLVRDDLAALPASDQPALLELLREVMTRTPPPYDAPVCTLFAWVSYCAGGGAQTSIALERALTTDPTYSLALLLQTMVLGQVSPKQLRTMTAKSARSRRRLPQVRRRQA
ncbi:MAG: uncharacterized protein JWO12_553 [Frankiales bacterium]|nr:uncharacterized protein [Frankiales bacterium]